MKSTAKATAVSRDLKEALERRGFTVTESIIANGSRLLVNPAGQSTAMSIRIQAQDNGIKDIFGNANFDFAPHDVSLAIQEDEATAVDVAKVMMDLGKQGFGLKFGSHATVLATAETAADAADAERHNSAWPTKGA